MANETKLGVATFAVLLGVFGYVLYGKYEDRLTALAGGDAEQSAGADPADDPLGDGDASLGTVTDADDTGDAVDFGDEPAADPEAPVELFGDEEPALAAAEPDFGAVPQDPADFAAVEPVAADPADDWDAGWGDEAVVAAEGPAYEGPEFEQAEFDPAEVVPLTPDGTTVAAAGAAGAGDAAELGWGGEPTPFESAEPVELADAGGSDGAGEWGEPTADPPESAGFEDAAAAWGFDVADAEPAPSTEPAFQDEPTLQGEPPPQDEFAVRDEPLEDETFAEAAIEVAEDVGSWGLAAADEATDAAEEALPLFFEESTEEPAEPAVAEEPILVAEGGADTAFGAEPVDDPRAPETGAMAFFEETEPNDPAAGPTGDPAFAAAEPAFGSFPEMAASEETDELPAPDSPADFPSDPTETAPAADAFAAVELPTVETADREPTWDAPPVEFAPTEPVLADATPTEPTFPSEPGFGDERGFGEIPTSREAPALTAPGAVVAEASPEPPRRDEAVRPAAAVVPEPFRFRGPKDRKIAEVRPGETYWTISKRAYGSVKFFKALARYNAKRIRDPRKLQPGMKVVCPTPEALRPYDPDLLAEAERAANPAPKLSNGFGQDERGRPVFVVGPNDTLGGIAHAHLGKASRWKQIYAINRDKIPDPNRLKPGTLLDLPADAAGLRRR